MANPQDRSGIVKEVEQAVHRRIEDDRFTPLLGAIRRAEVLLYSLATFVQAGSLEDHGKSSPREINCTSCTAFVPELNFS